jgi:membrane-associated phospholipid phosphatase
MKLIKSSLFLFFALLSFSVMVTAQSSEPASAQPQPTPSLEKKFFQNLLKDQRDIWLAPFHLNSDDAKWVVPLSLSTVALVATDRHTSGELVENGDNHTRLRISKDISQFGSAYVTGGVAAAFYLTGRASHNARARETGLLSAEALIDSGIVSGVLKLASQRQRPPEDDSSGEFFDGGSSFPSGHAISAWSLATVIAQEYGQHRPFLRYGLYGLATAVSLSRYTGRNHFLSDALVGSAMGYLIGRYVYRTHHDASLDDPKKKKITTLFPDKLIPRIVPLYDPRTRLSGAELSWQF